MPTSTAADFVRATTRLRPAPYLPEILLYQADEAFALWEQTERALDQAGLPPPFWAFAWAGGQGLARHVLDPATVTASEVDRFAAAAIELNAAANGVAVAGTLADVLDAPPVAEVVLAGDVFYARPMAERVLPFLDRAVARGARVLVGDPGRSYLPRSRFRPVASYRVPVVRALEDADHKRTTVWELELGPPSG